MRILHSPYEIVLSVIGKQKNHFSGDLRKSFFCLEIPVEDGILLFHSLTGELVKLENGEIGLWNDESLKEILFEKWFLVSEGLDETIHCDQVRNIISLLQKRTPNICRYTIFTTTDCNARCFYCFEHGQKRLSMDDDIADKTAQYMTDHSGNEDIAIRWFGGEPLYNQKAIDIICDRLRESNKKFKSSMVTNAYLFDEKTVEKALRSWNLQSVIITLDGTEEIYNRTKAYINKDGNAYQKVLMNIEFLLKAGVKVTVNLNMDAANADDLEVLAHVLFERFASYKGFGARCELLKEYVGKIHHFGSFEEAMDRRKRINQFLDDHGIKTKEYLDNGLKMNCCMADDPKAVTILPDGRIGKCEHFGDSQEIGRIDPAFIDPEREKDWKELYPKQEECFSCVCYPVCFRLRKCNIINEKCDNELRSQQIDRMKAKVLNTYRRIEKGA